MGLTTLGIFLNQDYTISQFSAAFSAVLTLRMINRFRLCLALRDFLYFQGQQSGISAWQLLPSRIVFLVCTEPLIHSPSSIISNSRVYPSYYNNLSRYSAFQIKEGSSSVEMQSIVRFLVEARRVVFIDELSRAFIYRPILGALGFPSEALISRKACVLEDSNLAGWVQQNQ